MEKLNTFFGLWFLLSVFGYAIILYKWLKGRSYRDEINTLKAKEKVKEQMLEILKQTLPKSRKARIALFNKLTGADKSNRNN